MIRKLVVNTVNLPVYWISLIWPKRRTLWVFGAWFGARYADNSRYLFEYVNKHHPQIDAIWLSNDPGVVDSILAQGYRAMTTYSVQGYLCALRAQFGIVSTGGHDLNIYAIGGTTLIQLWHGSPIKKILADSEMEAAPPSLAQSLYLWLFRFLKRNYSSHGDKIIATSPEVKSIFMSAFRVPSSAVHVTGYPRNDLLHRQRPCPLSQITYLPTHRTKSIGLDGVFHGFSANEMDSRLRALGLRLLIKLHPYDRVDLGLDGSSQIEVVDVNTDVVELLNKTHSLITDYSSVFFDFLLTGRPVVFAPLDLQAYTSLEREFYFDYDEITPGPKCRNWVEILDEIEYLVQGGDEYEEQRKLICDRFNTYQDADSSLRVYRLIMAS